MKKFFTYVYIYLAAQNIVESKYKSTNTISYSNNYWNKNFFNNNNNNSKFIKLQINIFDDISKNE